MKARAQTAVAEHLSLADFLSRSHDYDRDDARWSATRYYLITSEAVRGAAASSEDVLLEKVLELQKARLAERKRADEQAARGAKPGLQLKALQDWARNQPLNPADDFDDGIAYYNLEVAVSKDNWVDKDIDDVSQEDYTVQISYKKGPSLRFSAKSIYRWTRCTRARSSTCSHADTRRPIGSSPSSFTTDRTIFTKPATVRGHVANGRVLIAVPYMMTGAVSAFYAQDPLHQVAIGLIKELNLLVLFKGLMIATPTIAGGLTTTARVLGAGRSIVAGGATAARTAVLEIAVTVRVYGLTAEAGGLLARSAYTYYLTHAVAITTGAIFTADIALVFAGQDMGPISPGNSVTMASRRGSRRRGGVEAPPHRSHRRRQSDRQGHSTPQKNRKHHRRRGQDRIRSRQDDQGRDHTSQTGAEHRRRRDEAEAHDDARRRSAGQTARACPVAGEEVQTRRCQGQARRAAESREDLRARKRDDTHDGGC